MRVKGERTSSKDKKSNLAKYFNTFFKAKLQIQEKKKESKYEKLRKHYC